MYFLFFFKHQFLIDAKTIVVVPQPCTISHMCLKQAAVKSSRFLLGILQETLFFFGACFYSGLQIFDINLEYSTTFPEYCTSCSQDGLYWTPIGTCNNGITFSSFIYYLLNRGTRIYDNDFVTLSSLTHVHNFFLRSMDSSFNRDMIQICKLVMLLNSSNHYLIR